MGFRCRTLDVLDDQASYRRINGLRFLKYRISSICITFFFSFLPFVTLIVVGFHVGVPMYYMDIGNIESGTCHAVRAHLRIICVAPLSPSRDSSHLLG